MVEWKKWALLTVFNAVTWSALGIVFHDGWSWFMAVAMPLICGARAIREYDRRPR